MKERYIQYGLLFLDITSVAIGAFVFYRTVSLAYPAMIGIVLPYIMRENKLYWRHGKIYFQYWLQLGQLVRSYFLVFILFCVYTFLTQVVGAKPDPVDLALQFVLILGVNVAGRSIFTGISKLIIKKKRNRFVVIGTSKRAQSIGTEIELYIKDKELVGYIDGSEGKGPVTQERILGSLENLETIIEQNEINSIVVVLDSLELDWLLEVIDRVTYLPVDGYLYNDQFDVIRQRYKYVTIGDLIVSALNRKIKHRESEIFKRMMDIAISLGGLILVSPLLLLTALLIKISSKGPVFYISKRVKNEKGDTFNFLKFRSMYVRNKDPEKERGAGIDEVFSGNVQDKENTKVVDKHALTPIGRILRKSSIDELPQLINVLVGDMSLVGPRPTTEYEFSRYKDWHKRRLRVKPGITGLWQVVARSKTTFDEQVKLDLYYVDHQSIWFDIEILVKTIPVVLLGKGGG